MNVPPPSICEQNRNHVLKIDRAKGKPMSLELASPSAKIILTMR
jgi:hypothetical protein